MIEEGLIGQKKIDFEARFGRGHEIDLYFAPGRVNLIGDHTDYNGGLALPIAIEQGNYMLIRRTELPPVRLYSANLDLEARFLPGEVEKNNDWADYVRGVFLFAKEVCPELPPFDGLFFGDLPLESGLSSSASIELAMAVGLECLGCTLEKSTAVKIARRAENEFVGVSCGVMDQFTIAFAKKGHAILLDCDTLDFRLVPVNLRDVAIIVGHSGTKRSLVESAYNERRRECELALDELRKKLGPVKNLSKVKAKDFESARWAMPDDLARRAEHVIYENMRVEEAARCLERGDAKTLGHLMNRSHESLRDLYDVSSDELDALQEIAIKQMGVLGCRMTGAGFGGCVVALVEKDAVEKFLTRMPGMYWKATHLEADFIVISPGDGAGRLTGA